MFQLGTTHLKIEQIKEMLKTEDIKGLLQEKYENGDFRITKSGVKTVELQGIQFIADKDYILREPDYDYAQREIQWYESQSLYVKDIPGKVPAIWKQCADVNGKINSNYGWMIYSEENGSQYQNCKRALIDDPTTRQALMIYNRPTMHNDCSHNHMHDFTCCLGVQYFLNPIENGYSLKCIVKFRSNDAVFGYNSDYIWMKYVQDKLAKELAEALEVEVICEPIVWEAGSLHVYERHFKFLEN